MDLLWTLWTLWCAIPAGGPVECLRDACAQGPMPAIRPTPTESTAWGANALQLDPVRMQSKVDGLLR